MAKDRDERSSFAFTLGREMLDLDLKGSHVLVTGANGGIGTPTVDLLQKLGADVTATYNASSSNLDALADAQSEAATDASSALGKLLPLRCDLTDESSVGELFQTAEELAGKPVTILVLNHAIYESTPSPIATMSLSQFRRTIDVNLTSSFIVLKAFLARLKRAKEQGERDVVVGNVSVVMVGSTAGEFGEAGHADYAASKSGLTHGLLLSLKNEIVNVSPLGRANCVAPGWVATRMAEESMKDERVRYQAMATTPLSKIATPMDVAYQIAILASQKVSGHLTGQVVRLHGGMEGRLLNAKL